MTRSREELPDDKAAFAALFREALIAFMKEADRDTMPLQYLTTFLLVAIEPGLSVNEYAERAQVSKSVMSRHLLDIGPRARNQSVGFGLVTGRPKPMNLREHEYFLTPKGRALFERLFRILSARRP
jgi:DNA-binding MarR family transcriptional regulator